MFGDAEPHQGNHKARASNKYSDKQPPATPAVHPATADY